MAANNAGDIWDEIIQPGPADNGRIRDDTLAYLHHWVPLNPQLEGPNYADVAVALVNGKDEWRKLAAFYISTIWYLREISKAGIEMTAEKIGKMTGHPYDEAAIRWKYILQLFQPHGCCCQLTIMTS